MNSFMTIIVYISLVALYITSSAAVGRESGGREQREIKRWQDVGNGVENHQTSLENSITRTNVNLTQELWRIAFLNVDGAPYPPAVDGQPVYYDGMTYFVDSLGRFYSVYGNNGTIQWVTNTSRGNTVGTIQSYRRTPYVDQIRVCCAAREVICVRRSDGVVIWRNNNSDDTTSVGPDGRLTDYYTQAGDVGVVDGRLIVGRSSLQNSITPAQLLNSSNRDLTFKGGVNCFNLETGAVIWRFNTTSDQTQRNPQYGAGVGVYSSPGFDLFSQTVFIGTGQAYEPPVSPLSDSLLALDYVTGRLKWSFQVRPDDVYGRLFPDGPDRDVNTHPNIFEVVAKRASDPSPRIYRLVGVGSKDGLYLLFETVQPNPASPQLLSFMIVDTGSSLGGFQSTPAIHAGILYTATLSGVSENGTRIPFNSSNLFASSTKVSAYDIAALLEGRPANLWNNIEPAGFLNIPFGNVVYSQGMIFYNSFNGKLRGYNSTDGVEIFRRIPVPAGLMIFPGFAADTPLHGGTTIVDGKIIVGFGSSFMINAIGGVVTYGFPYRQEQRYDGVVPPAGSPGCTLGNQRCLSDGSGFQTCTYTGQGTNTDFGANQMCAPGTSCRSFNTNFVNCN